MEKINGIPADAPLWRGATHAELKAIIALLSKASYHYADDSGKEWGNAQSAKAEAAQEINRLTLPAMAIAELQKAQPQLVTFHDLIDAVLKDARK